MILIVESETCRCVWDDKGWSRDPDSGLMVHATCGKPSDGYLWAAVFGTASMSG